MEQVRSFIAIELPEQVKTCLRDLQAQLNSSSQTPAKWVDPDGIHLTLKFLGDVPAGKLDLITRAMASAAQGTAPFRLELKDPGVFPNLKRVQVAWVGLGGDLETLRRLQQRIEASLAPLGFAPESRAFTPHLTIARIRESASPAQRQELGQIIAGTRLASACIIEVGAINLMRSQLTREGAIYSRISLVALEKTE